MLDPGRLRDFRPLIMTPSHDGTFCANYVAGVVALMAEAPAVGLPVNFMFHNGESLVTRARNKCVATFLADPQWTHLMWIDADVGFSPQSIFRLLLSGHDVVGGVYPLKTEVWPPEGVPAGTTERDFRELYTRYTANSGVPGEETVRLRIDAEGFVAVREAPTGFMLIRREVLERMVAAYPDLRYVPEDFPPGTEHLHYRLFDVMVDPDSGRYLSEDYAFCRLWSALGGLIFVDANSNLSHRGHRTWRGDFGASLRRDVRHAVHAPKGMRYVVEGLEHLSPNPPGPL